MPPENNWNEYQKLVLAELERLNQQVEDQRRALTALQVQLGMLQVKSGVWGALGGLIPVLFLLVTWLLTRK